MPVTHVRCPSCYRVVPIDLWHECVPAIGPADPTLLRPRRMRAPLPGQMSMFPLGDEPSGRYVERRDEPKDLDRL
jgi:hypothetical protein